MLSGCAQDINLSLQVVWPDAPELKSEDSLLQQIKELYCSQSVSTTAKAWNDIRERALRDALTAVFIPQFERELRARLTADARELVCSSCCTKVFDWAAQGPLTVCGFVSTTWCFVPPGLAVGWQHQRGCPIRCCTKVSDPRELVCPNYCTHISGCTA